MRKFVIAAALLVGLATAGVAFAQEEAHFEGYWTGSNPPVVSSLVDGRGLVTALYPPLAANFTNNEYTWVMSGLKVTGTSTSGTTTYASYDLTNAQMSIYEDAGQDARPTFYDCPSDMTPTDTRYSNGSLYLRGHYTSFLTSYDTSTLTGTFTAQVNWDSGAHLTDLPPARRGAWKFGGTTTNSFACIPAGFTWAMTGRIFQVTTAAQHSTWGELRKMYQ